MCWPSGLLSTGGLISRSSSMEIEAPAAEPTEDSEAPPVTRATLPFHVCITKSHGAGSPRGVAIGHTKVKVNRSDTLNRKAGRCTPISIYSETSAMTKNDSCDRTCNETSAVTYKKNERPNNVSCDV